MLFQFCGCFVSHLEYSRNKRVRGGRRTHEDKPGELDPYQDLELTSARVMRTRTEARMNFI